MVFIRKLFKYYKLSNIKINKMKKFTLIVTLLVFTLFGKAEINTNLQKKVLKLKAKTDHILQKNNFSARNSEVSKTSVHKFPVYFNSLETQTLDSIVSQTYDAGNLIWKYDWMDVYEYDAQLRSIVWYEKEWNDVTGTWENVGKTETNYGTNGKIDFILMYSRSELTGELFVDSKMEVFFSNEEKLDSMIIYTAEPDNSWSAVSIQKYQYDGSGNIIQSEMWAMEEDEDGIPTGIIIKSMVMKYEYNNSGLMTLVNTYYYLEGEEFLYSNTKYEYYSSGKLKSAVNQEFNFSTFQMENKYKNDYTYNSAGDIDTEIDSDWNSSGETWIETYKYENTYSDNNFWDVSFPSFNMIFGTGDPEFILFNKAIVSDKTFEKVGDNWVQTDKANYYYSAGSTTNVNELDNPSVSFYPNPASNEITLNWNSSNKFLSLQIFQISGVKVLEQNTFSNEKISVSHLVKGMYLVKLLNGQQTVYAGKLIKN